MTVNINSDSHLVSVFPHMHLIGSEFLVTATLPDTSEIPIIYVDNWDFDWQLSYNFKQPISLPAGSVLNVTATYFNFTSVPVCGGLFSYESMFTFGNSTTRDSDGIPTPRDSTPPKVLSVTADAVDSALVLTVTFDEEIRVPHYPSAMEVQGFRGRVAAPDSITVAGNTLIIGYDDALKAWNADRAGDARDKFLHTDYRLVLRGFFGIVDLNGNFMDGDENGVGGELADDLVYAFQWAGVEGVPLATWWVLCATALALLGTALIRLEKRQRHARTKD